MKLILITSAKSSRGRYELQKPGLLLALALLVFVPMGFGVFAFYLSNSIYKPDLNRAIAAKWQAQLEVDQQTLTQIKDESETQLSALSLSLAKAHSRLIRVEALGQRLIDSGHLKKGEFDFSTQPALGGLQDELQGEAFAKPQFAQAMDGLLEQLERREREMEVLESLLDNQLLEKEVFLAGRPIKKGWMSSFFGKRLDPFTGKLAWHEGVDFAGKENAEIIAVASGVVTWSGDRYGYGLLVEIDHGGGFKTRYAHNKENLVELGAIVRKGQTLALMGSSGRSTGPHTHFEVLKNDRPVNPERYVYR
jgi:murein DD-endopeptidase MepM/ murein hydrolase activator NlpD